MNYLKQLNSLQQQATSLSSGIANLQHHLVGHKIPASAKSQAVGQQDDETLLTKILRCAMYVVQASGAGLTLYDPVKERLVFQAAIGDGAADLLGYEVPLEGSRHGLAFATGEIQAATPIHDEVEEKTGVKFRNVLVAPLIIGEDNIGTISAVNKQDGDHFNTEDIAAYQLFSDLAATLVQQQLWEDGVRDWLTGKHV